MREITRFRRCRVSYLNKKFSYWDAMQAKMVYTPCL